MTASPQTPSSKDAKKASKIDKKKPHSQTKATEKVEKNIDSRGSEKNSQKKSSKGKTFAILILLALLGVTGAGAYFTHAHSLKAHQRLATLEQRLSELASQKVEAPEDNEALNEALEKVTAAESAFTEKFDNLNQELLLKDKAIHALQMQLNQLKTTGVQAGDINGWKLTEADYLLNTAYRKLIIDKDLPSVVALLHAADKALSRLDTANVLAVRSAISDDLKTLATLKPVNEDQLMTVLSDLTAQVNGLMTQSLRAKAENAALSSNIEDWQVNLEKSANSFLTKFIKATPKESESQALLTPQQEIYLRENLRLRLQIALIAVERHQQALYQQSLEMVKDWVNRYFDVESIEVKTFLESLDKAMQETVAKPLPTALESVKLMHKLMDAPQGGL